MPAPARAERSAPCLLASPSDARRPRTAACSFHAISSESSGHPRYSIVDTSATDPSSPARSLPSRALAVTSHGVPAAMAAGTHDDALVP